MNEWKREKERDRKREGERERESFQNGGSMFGSRINAYMGWFEKYLGKKSLSSYMIGERFSSA